MTRADRRARMDHILARYQAGESAKVLAREYGLSAQHIISTAWRRRKQGGAA